MSRPGSLLVAVAASALLLVGCDRAAPPLAGNAPSSTAVLGGNAPAASSAAPAAPVLADAAGRPLPPVPAPPGTPARTVKTGPDSAAALWIENGHVVVASYAPTRGWNAPQPLETIFGQASDPQLASDGQGHALAVWQHSVGRIESLRFAHFDAATGWTRPDVIRGALPRPADTPHGPLELHMDKDGSAVARWPSGFDAQAWQLARFSAEGWRVDLAAAADPAGR